MAKKRKLLFLSLKEEKVSDSEYTSALETIEKYEKYNKLNNKIKNKKNNKKNEYFKLKNQFLNTN